MGEKERQTYYAELEHLIKSNGLQDKVFLKGRTSNVPEVLRKSDIFAFPSFWEGFGLALAEGLSAGLPAVGFKTCPGVNELIKHGESGYLCRCVCSAAHEKSQPHPDHFCQRRAFPPLATYHRWAGAVKTG